MFLVMTEFSISNILNIMKYQNQFPFPNTYMQENSRRPLDQLGRFSGEVKTDSFRNCTNGIESRLSIPYESANTVI